MKYIKTYENFKVNEELAIEGFLVAVGFTALLAWIGQKAFQVIDTALYKKNFTKVDEVDVDCEFTIEETDYGKSAKEAESKGLKKLFMWLGRNLGLQVKTKKVKKTFKFDVLEDKNKKKFYSIKVNVKNEKSQGSKEILVFSESQFNKLKDKCEKGGYNPMTDLTKKKNVEEMNLKMYSPLQIG